jgi:hypothetical protein
MSQALTPLLRNTQLHPLFSVTIAGLPKPVRKVLVDNIDDYSTINAAALLNSLTLSMSHRSAAKLALDAKEASSVFEVLCNFA